METFHQRPGYPRLFLIAAEPMTTVKPTGYTLEAIDHDRLKSIMRQHSRLKE